MSTLDQEQDVVDLAEKLGLSGSPVAAIINFCQHQIDTWVRDAGGVHSVGELEAVVTSRLHLVFEEINDDDDFDRLKAKYIPMGEFVFAALSVDMDEDTFGTMVRLKDGTHVAVIDCRGEKAARRFFTRWHEIAHLLVEEDVERQVFRATDEPLEKLMDQIAGHVGFYDSIFTPLFHSAVIEGEPLTFEGIESIRQGFCSSASFQATLFACQRRMLSPMLYVEARMAHSESERRSLKQMRMFDDVPEQKLRVRLSVPNQAASSMGLKTRWNMRVPETSILFSTFHGKDESETSGQENLCTWTFSSGDSLMNCDVFIQARRLGDFVMATIQPIRTQT
jgi:hypothetical protein